MATKIRLSRHGRKNYAFYHIVVADSRAPRDGKFIEKIGTYNPNTNPATVELNFDSALSWISKGAQPTDTARAILSYKGVMMMHHLNGGVKKGALTQEQAETKFNTWLKEKESKIQAKIDALAADAQKSAKARLEAETKIKEDKEKAVAAKLAAAAAAAAPAPAETEEIEEAMETIEGAIETAEAEVAQAQAAAEVVAEESVATEEETPAAE